MSAKIERHSLSAGKTHLRFKVLRNPQPTKSEPDTLDLLPDIFPLQRGAAFELQVGPSKAAEQFLALAQR